MTKFLGVYFAEKLKLNYNLFYISNKLQEKIAISYHARPLLYQCALTILYSALILPCISYCAMVFGSTYYANLLPLFIKQKHIKIICNAKYREHTSQMIYDLKLLTVFQIVRVQTAIFMYNVFNTMLPINFLAYFSQKLTMNKCVTRQINIFKQLYVCTTKNQQCVLIVGVKIWNNIDDGSIASINMFSP